MKPLHEQVWDYTSGSWPHTIFRGIENGAEKVVDVWGDHEDCDLIAAAPQMARVLLHLANANGTCAYCKRDGDTDPCNTLATGHHAGCIIGDVLELAGVGDWPADFRPDGTW